MDLTTPISKIPNIGPTYKKRLEKLNIATIGDLLTHIPHRYVDYRLSSDIGKVQPGEVVTVKGKVDFIKNQYTRFGKKIQLAEISDKTGKIKIIWFNQPFLIMNIRKGDTLSLSGKADWFGNGLALISPEYEKMDERGISIHTGRLIPIYPETAGVSSKWIRGKIFYLLRSLNLHFDDTLPKNELNKLNLIELNKAFSLVHYPEDLKDADIARERLAFDELLLVHLKGFYRKDTWEKNEVSHKIKLDKKEIARFIGSLPFTLTKSQEKSIEEILKDLSSENPMNRLLEGDVGSGKTVVAATACFLTFLNGYQSVFMAPTQILAHQHFETLNMLFSSFKIRVKLITGAGERGDLGTSDIYIGTHALIHRVIEKKQVALVVIDEQHRFGVEQRAHLINKVGNKYRSPHVLTMTATPIPRTVALTLYGDLDLSILSEMPKGRIPVTTWVVPPVKRDSAYEWIDQKIKSQKIQAFIICPLIEESQVETMKEVRAVTKELDRLKLVFKDLKLGLLHGRLKAKEKEETLTDFKKGKIDILVSTPVVEVGIDVPNATIMLIEDADRFGLAQLHQLIGRVGRGDKKSYCLLFTNIRSKTVLGRLTALTKSYSGFELAEMDLKFRGPGEIFGTKQHGFFDLKIANWQDEILIQKSKKFADYVMENKSKFKPLLTKIIPSDIAPN
jgi:ATP-dependent DNA helicase RecG